MMHGWSVLPCVRPVDAALSHGPLAIMLSARSGPGQKHAVKSCLWHKWGVPISRIDRLGALSSPLALSNFVGARRERASLKLPAKEAGSLVACSR